MGSLLSKLNGRNTKSTCDIQGEDMKSKPLFVYDIMETIESPPSPPESPIIGLKCSHVFLKTKYNPQPHLCSKCGFIIKSPNQVLKKIGAENKRREEFKLKIRTEMYSCENESNKHVAIPVQGQGQGNEEFEMSDSFVEYPPIAPGRVPLVSLPQNDVQTEKYRFEQHRGKTCTQDESYFLQKSNPKFMTIRSGRPKVRYSLQDEF